MTDDAWPAQLLASNHPVREWRSHSDATWEAIRQDYLSGTPARDLCDRYEVALSTLRLRAKDGGWRRADQADSDLFPADADLWARDGADNDAPRAEAPAEEESWADLAERARFRLRRAIAAGRASEAASWLRVHQRLCALAAAEDTPDDPPEPAEPAEPEPDPLDVALSVARQVGTLARRGARATDEAEKRAIECEIEVLKGRAGAVPPAPGGLGDGGTLDSLDSLDPVFSDPEDEAEAGRGLSP